MTNDIEKVIIAQGSIEYNELVYSYLVSKNGENIMVDISVTLGGKNNKKSFEFIPSKENSNKYYLTKEGFISKVDFVFEYNKDDISLEIENIHRIGNIRLSLINHEQIIFEKTTEKTTEKQPLLNYTITKKDYIDINSIEYSISNSFRAIFRNNIELIFKNLNTIIEGKNISNTKNYYQKY